MLHIPKVWAGAGQALKSSFFCHYSKYSGPYICSLFGIEGSVICTQESFSKPLAHTSTQDPQTNFLAADTLQQRASVPSNPSNRESCLYLEPSKLDHSYPHAPPEPMFQLSGLHSKGPGAIPSIMRCVTSLRVGGLSSCSIYLQDPFWGLGFRIPFGGPYKFTYYLM